MTSFWKRGLLVAGLMLAFPALCTPVQVPDNGNGDWYDQASDVLDQLQDGLDDLQGGLDDVHDALDDLDDE